MLTRRDRPDGFVEPCIPTLAARPPSGPDWVHEIKHDGYRLIVRRDGDTVRLFTRRGHDGVAVFDALHRRHKASACKLGFEGIVSKRLGAPYRSGPSRDWIKVKISRTARRGGGWAYEEGPQTVWYAPQPEGSPCRSMLKKPRFEP